MCKAEEHQKYLIDTKVEDYIKLHSSTNLHAIAYQIYGTVKLYDGDLYCPLIF